MTTLSRKERARRAKISASLSAYWVRVKTGQTPRSTYHKPIVTVRELDQQAAELKKQAALKRRRERYYERKGQPVPKRKATPAAKKRRETPAKPAIPAKPAKPDKTGKAGVVEKGKVVEEGDKYYAKDGIDFVDYADDRGSHIWLGPWRDKPPEQGEVHDARDTLNNLVEKIADHYRSDNVKLDLGLKQNLRAWALRAVINADRTVSSEVRIAIPVGKSVSQIAQYIQSPIENIGPRYWVTPIIVYESRTKDEFGKPLPSPFEARDGKAEIRAFSVKADDNIRVKAVTGFLKAEEMADEWKEFIIPSYLRVKINFSDRNPISIYEVKRREEAKKEREKREAFVKSMGFKPVKRRK